ncbi:MFS transporter [Caballeronia sp. M23-90]
MRHSILSKAEAREFRHGWPALLAATIGCFAGLTTIPFYSLGSFITPLQTAFGWGRGEISSSFLYLTLVLALTSPLLGYLIDRLGVRTISLISIPLLSLVLFSISRFQGSIGLFHSLYALAALIGGGATPIAYSRTINANFNAARGLALGISLAGMGLAAVLLPSLLSVVIRDHGWRAGGISAYRSVNFNAMAFRSFLYQGQSIRRHTGHRPKFYAERSAA